jgi:hypothetical protein
MDILTLEVKVVLAGILSGTLMFNFQLLPSL